MSNKRVIKIVADSGADLTAQLLRGRDIEILTMPLTHEGRELPCRDNQDTIKIYAMLRDGAIIKTAQVPLSVYIECFSAHARRDEAVVYISLSSGLTGSGATASLAASLVREEYPHAIIEILDSYSATAGFANGVLAAYDAMKRGASICDIVNAANDAFNRTRHLFSVPGLSYLVRGGRVSPLMGAIGDCLSVKPFLDIDPNGKLVETERVRGEKKMRSRLVDELVRAVDANGSHRVYLLHGDDIAAASEILERAAKKVDVSNVCVSLLGAVIGVHTGPGMLAVVYEDESYARNIPRLSASCAASCVCHTVSACALHSCQTA